MPDRLRDMILSGELRQGERVLEIATAARLGISRTPLRPALAALAQEGLLRRAGARGYVVRAVSREDIMESFLVRAELEGLAVRLAARRGLGAGAKARLAGLLDEGDRLLRERPEEFCPAFVAMNEAFHTVLLAASGNACLIELTAQALARPLLSSRLVHFGDDVALERSHDDHREIVRAIRRGEDERARAIMVEHILRSRDILARRFGGLEEAAAENGAEPDPPRPAPSTGPVSDPARRADRPPAG